MGVGFALLVPLLVVVPSSPKELAPKVQRVPSPFNARLWPLPAAMAVTFVRTWVGVGFALLVPLLVVVPSSPKELAPKVQRVPSPFNARLWPLPAAMAVTFVRTWVGVGFALSVPLLVVVPSCP